MNKYGQNRSLNDQKLNTSVARSGFFSSPSSSTIIMSGAAIICSLITPAMFIQSSYAELLGWLVCIICAICTAICIKRFFILAVLAVLASFVISLTGSTVALATAIGPIFSIALISTVISRRNQNTVLPAIIIPIICYGLALTITADFISALLSLCTAPVAITLGIANKRGASKSSATLAGTIAMSVISIVAITAAIYVTYGSLSIEMIRAASSDFATALNDYCELAISAAGNAITPEIKQIISASTDTVINMIPGIIVASAYVTSYICQSASVSLSDRIGEEPPKDNYIAADVCTAAVFIVAYIFSFSSGASSGISIESVVGSNLALMLTPCLFVVGLRSLKMMPYKLGIIGLLFSIGTIVMLFVSESSAFTVFALAGAIYTLISYTDAWAKQHYNKGENK